MESLNQLWKKTDFSLAAAKSSLTPEEVQTGQQNPQSLAVLHSFNLTYFFGHVVDKNNPLLISHKDVAKEFQLLGLEAKPGQFPAKDLANWVQEKSRFVSTFSRVFRKRYSFDLVTTRDRLRRSALKIHEDLALMENLLSKENFTWDIVETNTRNTSLELTETLTSNLKG